MYSLPQVPEAARAELQLLYAELAQELEPFRRYCDARGLCCNFRATDHMLYLTGLEAAEMAATPHRPEVTLPNMALSETGKCPYLSGTQCGAREHRAIGCRIYYCDRTYEDERNALYEKYLKAAREIEVRYGIAHDYVPVTQVNFSASVKDSTG